jgi:hypothetical protein
LEKIEEKLMAMFAESMPPGLSAQTMPGLKPLVEFMAEALQQGRLVEEMEAMEAEEGEDEMDVELGEVLTVGDTFTYVYDMGSSTTLSLRVLDEREGMVAIPALDADGEEPEEEEEDEGELESGSLGDGEDEGDEEDEYEYGDEYDIAVLARNQAPEIACQVCGKQATLVDAQEESINPAEHGYCDTCAKKLAEDESENLLPVANSPRVGICDYTGDEEEYDEDAWEDEEDED